MPTDEIYKRAAERLRREGRLTDYRAGELKTSYILRRKLFGFGALLTAASWLVLIGITASWLATAAETIVLGVLFLYLMRQTTLLEYEIGKVSQKSSDHMDQFLNEFLTPFPELHRLFKTWRSEGPLWRHDESRLVELAQYARL